MKCAWDPYQITCTNSLERIQHGAVSMRWATSNYSRLSSVGY